MSKAEHTRLGRGRSARRIVFALAALTAFLPTIRTAQAQSVNETQGPVRTDPFTDLSQFLIVNGKTIPQSAVRPINPPAAAGGNIATLDQSGSDNVVTIDQTGSVNKASATQTGNSNVSTLTAVGTGNTLTSTQVGNADSIAISVQGDSNAISSTQIGSRLSYGLQQIGSNANITVTQVRR